MRPTAERFAASRKSLGLYVLAVLLASAAVGGMTQLNLFSRQASTASPLGENDRFTPPFVAGPQRDIACPPGAFDIGPGTNIQAAVDSHNRNTTFCLKRGTHTIASAITPKSGDMFVGEYEAILDGSGWTSDDPNQGAFRAHEQDIDDVTVRNLVIRNMPQKGIHAYYAGADRWTIEYNELVANGTGVAAPNGSIVRNNYIHHNKVGGYAAYRVSKTLFENNDIAANGPEQKIVQATDVTFRNNFVHDNLSDGIWYDTDNTGTVVEGNEVDDNGREGISYEISGRGVIRNNTVRRNATTGIFISTSKDVEIYNNTLDHNLRGIQYFLNCGVIGDGNIGYDLRHDVAHDNVVIVGGQNGAYANGLAHLSVCTPAQVGPYIGGMKELKFERNRYVVPSPASKYWFWGLSRLTSLTAPFAWGTGSVMSWREWGALGHDTDGAVLQ